MSTETVFKINDRVSIDSGYMNGKIITIMVDYLQIIVDGYDYKNDAYPYHNILTNRCEIIK